MAEESSMESVIDRLVGEHGYEAVYSYIMERMKRDFEFMGGVIGAVKEEVKVIAPVKEKKPVVKKKVQVVAEGGAEAVAEVVPAENTVGNVVAPATVVVAAAPAEQKKKEETGLELPLEGDAPEQNLSVKQRQSIQAKQTRARLDKEGLTVEMMLTVENMGKWLAAGKSYAEIASEEVGCLQKVVSDFAKAHDLKSAYVGKNGVLVAIKRGMK
jgi:hypothetical protein